MTRSTPSCSRCRPRARSSSVVSTRPEWTTSRVLGVGDGVTWEVAHGSLTVTLPDRLPVTPALTLRLSPAGGVGPRGV